MSEAIQQIEPHYAMMDACEALREYVENPNKRAVITLNTAGVYAQKHPTDPQSTKVDGFDIHYIVRPQGRGFMRLAVITRPDMKNLSEDEMERITAALWATLFDMGEASLIDSSKSSGNSLRFQQYFEPYFIAHKNPRVLIPGADNNLRGLISDN